MKVVSILGGLGSQMQKYAFYLMLCKKSGQKCYIDTTFFLQKNSWNGYELGHLFNIKAPDMKNVLTQDAIERITNNTTSYLKENLEFLTSNNNEICYYFLGNRQVYKSYGKIHEKYRILKHKFLMIKLMIFGQQSIYPRSFFCEKNNSYFDEYLMRSDELFRDVKEDVIRVFQFPAFCDEKNIRTSELMKLNDSVAVHVRRTDHLGDNGKLYKRKYYAKSINCIRDKTGKKLSFYIFSDDIEWCKNHLSELGLLVDDDLTFVDWNSGVDSFRDMQLMTYCHHNVLAISSFSWWGYYLSPYKDKIVCAPEGYWTEVEFHF